MDIGSSEDFPIGNLSNFTPHAFVMDGVACASMEGFLQSLKFEDLEKQVAICSLYGVRAKRKGSKRNKYWKVSQQLHWQGEIFERGGEAYQLLLDRAFDALSTNLEFQQALLATGTAFLTHDIGKHERTETVLTIDEFCGRLMAIRERLIESQLQGNPN